MVEEILNKISKNLNCDLNIEELRVLYELDSLCEELRLYRDNRSDKVHYNDFCKLFGSESVATSPNEITENTICYLGSLFLINQLPTYNLKYIYGTLLYANKEVFNLENLEIVYIDAMINFIEKYEGLDNLKMVGNFLELNYIQDGDLSDMEYVRRLGLANVQNLEKIKFPKSVERLYFKRLESSDNFIIPNKLKYVSIPSELYPMNLPDNIEQSSYNSKMLVL